MEAAQRYEVHTQSSVTPDASSWKVPAADCQILHLKQAHMPSSAVSSNVMNSGAKLKPQGQYVSKQASGQNLRLSSRTVTNKSNQANGNVNSYVSPPQPAQICLNYNRNVRARCELPGNVCKFQHIHKCVVCLKYGCKSINHKSVLRDNNQNAQDYVTTLSGKKSNFDSVNVKQGSIQSNSDQALDKILHEVQSLSVCMEKLEHTPPSPHPPRPPSDCQSKCPVFGCPAITALPSDLKIPKLDFSNRHILWTPVASAGVSLPLPLNSCCSVSLVSQSHADVICQKSPQLTYQKLEQPISVAVVTSATQLNAVAVLQVRISWENGQSSIFSMLVVPNLAWPILFGQNNLSQTVCR